MADRLTDLDHVDELNRMKGRLFALSASFSTIPGACADVISGFHQLLLDVGDAMASCAEAFEAERQLRIKETRGGARD